MDTSFLSAGPVTWPVLFAFAAFVIALGKLADWASNKLRAGTKDAVSPLTIDMAAAKIEIRALDEKLNAFKIEVARTYVTGDVIQRLERRIDDLVTSVRAEMKETRETMLKAIMNRPLG
jgi:biopolymer transport protein ExbB/TolQ